MGGDGQALTNKRTLLEQSRVYNVQDQVDDVGEDAKRSAVRRRMEQWISCAMSLTRLEAPLAFGLDGRIFSLQSVLEYLQAQHDSHDATDEVRFGIKKMADVREIANTCIGKDGYVVCPLTHYSTTSGVHDFVGFWTCGHVTAKRAVDNIAPEVCEVSCPLCGVDSIMVPLAPLTAEVAARQQSQLRSYLRKQHKRRRRDDDG